MGSGSLSWVQRPGSGLDHLLPSSAEVKERIELYLYSPSEASRPDLEHTLHITMIKNLPPSASSGQGPVAGTCECGNERSVSIKCGELLY